MSAAGDDERGGSPHPPRRSAVGLRDDAGRESADDMVETGDGEYAYV